MTGEGGADLAALRGELTGSLRWRRQAAGLTQLQAAGALEWSRSKLLRIELGTVRVSVTDVQAMLRVSEDEAERLAAAARRLW